MNRHRRNPIKIQLGAVAPFCCALLFLTIFSESITAQELSREEKKEKRKAKKQEKIESGKLMITPLAGPAYTPELGFTIAGVLN